MKNINDISLQDCMLYAGSVKSSGYPKSPNTIIRRYGKAVADLHRFIYLFYVGDISADMVVDHICGNTLCINPDHLQQITQLENIHRSPNTNASKTICPAGHQYDRLSPSGRRTCTTCQAAKNRLRASIKTNRRLQLCA